jgi:hypothetical protein
MQFRHLPTLFTLASLVLGAAQGQSAWTDWTQADQPGAGQETAIGTLGGVTVTFTGQLNPGAQTGQEYNFWNWSSWTYTSPLVDTPPQTSDILRLTGGANTGEQVITFSQPVRDPILAILSLGAGSTPARFEFSAPFVIENNGPGYYGNGPLTLLPNNVLEGREGHGLVRFPGEFTELRFTAPVAESWSGFTLGTAGAVGVRSCGGATVNSTGYIAAIGAAGSTVFQDNDLRLSAGRLPVNTFGYFLCSQGTLCLGGSIGRYVSNVSNSGSYGMFGQEIDLLLMPSPNGFVSAAPGETWHFQCWFRDAVNGVSTSNFTDTVIIHLQ